MKHKLLNCMAAMGLAAAALLPSSAWAKYPEKPIRLVVPFPPGGGTDVLARLTARNMSAVLGQEVIVDNKGGAGTIIGGDAVAKAAPDGYTLLLSTASGFSINPQYNKKLPYKPEDFVHIGLISESPVVLVAPFNAPAKNLQELVRSLKDKETPIATAGKGSQSHLSAVMFFNAINAKFRPVHYRGEAPALIDLLGGQVPIYFASIPGTLSYLKTEKLRGYAVTTTGRSPAAPDIPSFTEQGMPEVLATSWFGISAPKGTPQEAVNALAAALSKALEDKAMQDRLAADGATTRKLSISEFNDYMKRDYERWGKVLRAANIEED